MYEAFFEGLVLFIILFFYFNKKNSLRKFGYTSVLFLSLYALFLFFIEFVREPDVHIGLFYNFFSMGQILSIPIFIFGILIIQNVKQKKN